MRFFFHYTNNPFLKVICLVTSILKKEKKKEFDYPTYFNF